MRHSLLPALLLTLAANAPHAHASPILYTIQFAATDAFEGIPPDPVLGTISVTLDPTLSYPQQQTSGITVNQLNLPFSQPVTPAFMYDPTRDNGELIIGGTVNGGAIDSGTADFLMLVFGIATPQPTFYQNFFWSDIGFNSIESLDQVSGTVTEQPVVPTPEPSTITLIGTGSLAFARLLGTRKSRHHA